MLVSKISNLEVRRNLCLFTLNVLGELPKTMDLDIEVTKVAVKNGISLPSWKDEPIQFACNLMDQMNQPIGNFEKLDCYYLQDYYGLKEMARLCDQTVGAVQDHMCERA